MKFHLFPQQALPLAVSQPITEAPLHQLPMGTRAHVYFLYRLNGPAGRPTGMSNLLAPIDSLIIGRRELSFVRRKRTILSLRPARGANHALPKTGRMLR